MVSVFFIEMFLSIHIFFVKLFLALFFGNDQRQKKLNKRHDNKDHEYTKVGNPVL